MARIRSSSLVFLSLLCWLSIRRAESLKYMDPSQRLNVRIKDLMGRMTLAEKIGQMTQIERKVASPEVMKDYFIGSVVSGGGSSPSARATAEDWVNMVNELQNGSLSTRLGIPMIYGIDAIHGHNNVYGATIFPHNIGLGATRDPELVKRIGAATALEVRATGITYAFAPCIAVCRDPTWGRCYESFSEDPNIVQEMTELIPGLQGDPPANYTKRVPYINGEVSEVQGSQPAVERLKQGLDGPDDARRKDRPDDVDPVVMKDFIGGAVSDGGSSPSTHATAEDWVNMINKLQSGSLSTHLGIPMIYGIDAIHGHNNVYAATIFLHNIGLGATRNKVAGCAKHFVGDGGTSDGVDESNAIMDRSELFGIHMPPYYDSIDKGVATVMLSYSSLNGRKIHADHDLVTGFLKNKLKFRGFVISDWQGIDRITTPSGSNYTYSVQAGIGAGIDMVMVPFNYTQFINNLTALVQKNVIPMTRIDDAVRRILRVKFILGLFENPLADHNLADQIGKKEHRELAREAVRKSLVLLKNGKNNTETVLPLPKKATKILVAGSHADNLGYQCGGWTIVWQGASGNITIGTTILDAIKSTVDPATDVVFSENPDAGFLKDNDGFSYAIVVVGEPPYAEFFGDSPDLALPPPGPSTIQTVCGAVKCVVVIVSGRPVVIEPFADSADALVAAWLPGTEGQGVADVLFGDYGFTGRLSRTWFRSFDQLPMNIGDKNYDPLFPLGFGLRTEPTTMAR